MKYFLATILIVGILSAAGSLIMMDHHGSCVMSLFAGADCPEQSSAFAFFNIHLNFLRNFSEGFLANIIAFSLLFALLISQYFNPHIKAGKAIFSVEKFFDLKYNPHKIKLIGWFSLLENSPVLH